jgi:hypothetical protein
MTDRFYPVGLPSDEDAWKTSYEVQNEMRSFARSAYPPGTAIHQPGARDKFGFSNCGPHANRLTQSHLSNFEEVDIEAPRLNHALPRIQVADDRETFVSHDVPEMTTAYNSPVATATFSPSSSKMSKSRSVPALTKTVVPQRLSEPNAALQKLEDDHFSYFVPKGLAREHRDKLASTTLSKLRKVNKISFPFTGEGTGFKSQSPAVDWWPAGAYTQDQFTSYRTSYGASPGFFRAPAGSSP